jgi:hypothetical protein
MIELLRDGGGDDDDDDDENFSKLILFTSTQCTTQVHAVDAMHFSVL